MTSLLGLCLSGAALAQDEGDGTEGEEAEGDEAGEEAAEDEAPRAAMPQAEEAPAAAMPQDEEAPAAAMPEVTKSEYGEEGWGGDDDAGWGDDGDQAGFAEAPSEDGKARKASPLSFGGSLQTEEAFWLESRDDSALAKARQSLDLYLGFRKDWFRAKVSGHGEYDLAMQLNQDQWNQATLDEYLYQALLREAWVSAVTGPVDTTLGRQVVGWGEGRTISIVDVVNPRDLREPGMVDLEDLRLPVTMARVTLGVQSDGFWKGNHRFEAMVVPEADFGFRSPPNGPFGNLPGVVASAGLDDISINGIDDFEGMVAGADVSWNHLQKRWDPANIQAFGRWTWRGRGVDLGLMGASVLDQQGVLVMPELLDLLTAANLGEPVTVDLDHLRYTLVGQSGVVQLPWFLVRWELAWKHDLPVNTGQVLVLEGFAPSFDIQTSRTDLAQGLIGLSWSGWKGTTVDLDVVEGFLLDDPGDVIFPVDASAWALRVAKPLLRQRMEVEGVVLGWGWTAEHGMLARAGASYDILDSLEASVMLITYQPGDERGPLLGFEQHDRAQVGLRWDF